MKRFQKALSSGFLPIIIGLFSLFLLPSFAFASTFPSTTNYSSGGDSTGFASCDFNGDGTPDFAVVNSLASGTVDILLSNTTSHTYTTAVEYPTGIAYPTSVTCGAYDSGTNSYQDIVVASTSSNQYAVLLNNGNGTFGTATVYSPTTFNAPQGMVTLDFNNDGKPDIAVSNNGTNKVSLLEGNGNGTFTELSAVTVGNGALTPGSIATGDFNGDGKADLAVTNTSDNTVTVLLGNNDGTFPTSHTYSVGTGPVAITSANLGNGQQDLIVADNTSDQVSVLKGNGDGTFGTATNYSASFGTHSVTVADFNGDGHPDVVVTNQGSGTARVQLFPGDGAGNLETPTPYNPSGGTEIAVLNGNYTGDGNHDLAVLNASATNSVSIVINTPAGPLDHFSISTIGAKLQGGAISMTVTALGATGLTEDTYYGSVNLSINTGTISPTTSGTFSEGVLTFSATPSSAGLGQVITVTDNGGTKTGTSNAFNVYTTASLLQATGLIGQSTYTANGLASPPTQTSVYDPSYTAIDTVNHRLFVADQSNNRILVYPLDSNNNITTSTASYVFGQSSYTTGGFTTPTASDLSGVHGLAYDPVNDRLFVADQAHFRVLIFDANPADMTANGIDENATYVLGQPNFTSDSAASPTQSGMGPTRGLAYDSANDRLFVTDAADNRIMIFDVSPTTLTTVHPGIGGAVENAEYVIGQPNFTTGTAGLTQTGLNSPAGLAYDPVNDRLFVSELTANRVTVFNVSPATLTSLDPGFGTALSASYVIGQPNFTTGTASTSQSGLNTPRGMAYDPVSGRLFVGDAMNSRIMIFDASPATLAANGNGENAQNLIGSIDFNTVITQTTQATFDGDPVRGPTFDPLNNTLFVVDGTSNRVLEFSFIQITTSSIPSSGTVGTAYTPTTIATTGATGTSQSFRVASGSLPAGLSLNTSTGTISGTPTAAGTSTFAIEADDNFLTGPYIDQVVYTITVAAPASSGGSGAAASGHGGGFIPPYLAQVSPMSTAGAYVFSSNESGTLAYSGCAGSTAYAVVGNNTTTLSNVSPSCTIQLTDLLSRTSNMLQVGGGSTTVLPVTTTNTTTSATTGSVTSGSSAFVFTKSLDFGDYDPQVMELQEYLNAHGSPVAASGPGSPGNETEYFGLRTKQAVIAFQEAHAADILAPLGPTEGTGAFHASTRAYVNSHP